MAYPSCRLTPDTKLGTCNFASNWFVVQLAAPLLRTAPHNARELIGAALALQHAQQQPYDLHHELQNSVHGDAQEWTPTFGNSAALVGGDVGAATTAPSDNYVAGVFLSDLSSGGDGRHWVVVRAGSDAVGEQLHQFVLDHPQMTVGQLLQTREYQTARRFAERNAQRLGAMLAGALCNDHQTLEDMVACEPDMSARTRGNLARPMLLQPTFQHLTNAIVPARSIPSAATIGLERDDAFYLSDATAIPVDGAVLKLVDARRGFMLQRPAPGADWLQPLAPTDVYDRQEQNEAFWEAKRHNRGQPHKEHVHKKFLNRQGETPSSASRALWNQRWIGDQLPTNGVQLVPHVAIIPGQRARLG